MSEPTPERRFGRYLLVRALARGGMGQVYLAVRPGPHGVERPCVVKLIRPEFAADPDLVRRFIEEARVLVSLSHRNIVQMYEFGQVGAEYFMAMEYVEGVSLATLLREGGPLPVALALLVAREMLSALGCAHRHVDDRGSPAEIVHRDVSPSNVLVSLAGDVKLVDFGLALSRERDRLTLPGLVVGTREYQAPEVIRLAPATPRSDLYSVGACLHEMLTGLRLSQARQPAGGPLPPPSAHRSSVPVRLDAICLQALDRDPARRQTDAEALRREVQQLLAELAPAVDADALAALVTERAGRLVPDLASEVAPREGPSGSLPERSLAVSPHLGRPAQSRANWEIVTGVVRLDLEPLSDPRSDPRTDPRPDDTLRTRSQRGDWEERTWVDAVTAGSQPPVPVPVSAFVMPISSNPGLRSRATSDRGQGPPSSGRIAARRWSSPATSSGISRRARRPPAAGRGWIWVALLAALAAGGLLISPAGRATLLALLG